MPQGELTTRQKQVLQFMQRYDAKHGIPPTHREIAAHFAFNVAAAQGHLIALTKKGYLEHKQRTSRAYRLRRQQKRCPHCGKRL